MVKLSVIISLLILVSLINGAVIEFDRGTITNIYRTPLDKEFTPGREVLVDLVEIPANGSLERHWHPGEEFHYYLEGEAEIIIDDMPPIKGIPGTVGHVPYKKKHKAITKEQSAKILVFRVHTTGEQTKYPAD